MAQFIQYLYEYENGQRARNLGFMKVDKQMDKTVIQIYAKQLDEVTEFDFRGKMEADILQHGKRKASRCHRCNSHQCKNRSSKPRRR